MESQNPGFERIPFGLKGIYIGLANHCLLHGEYEEQLGGGHAFTIDSIPPLKKHDIESITYIPPIQDEDGRELGEVVSVVMRDGEIKK